MTDFQGIEIPYNVARNLYRLHDFRFCQPKCKHMKPPLRYDSSVIASVSCLQNDVHSSVLTICESYKCTCM